MSSPPSIPQPTERSQLVFGGVFVVIGVGLVGAMTLSPDGLQVPYWVAVAAGSTFTFAGLSIMARARGWLPLAHLMSLLTVLGLSAPGLWILLDPAEKHCTATIGSVTSGASDFMCRAVFGFGGALTLIVGIVFAAVLVHRLRRRRDRLRKQTDTGLSP